MSINGTPSEVSRRVVSFVAPAHGGRFAIRSTAPAWATSVKNSHDAPAAVGIVGERIFRGGGAVDPRVAVPSYLRPSGFEPRLPRP